MEGGSDFVKIFPCSATGGAKYIQSLKGPLPQIPMIPTGGVNLNTAADFIRAGVAALGVGGELVSAAALKSGDTAPITERREGVSGNCQGNARSDGGALKMRACVRIVFAAAVAVGVALGGGGWWARAQAPAADKSTRERAAHAWDSPRPDAPKHIQCVKIAVENATSDARPASDIVIPIGELRKVAPDFTPGAVIVTATDATTVEEDASVMATEELPSQVDADDNEAQASELAFQIDLKPHQKRIVTISYGEGNRIWKLRGDYAKRTDALFSWKFEGPGWENDVDAFRLYFDERNGIDLYGKIRPTLQLRKIGSPDYLYYDESPEGRDIFKVGASMGIGGVGILVNGQVGETSGREGAGVARGFDGAGALDFGDDVHGMERERQASEFTIAIHDLGGGIRISPRDPD